MLAASAYPDQDTYPEYREAQAATNDAKSLPSSTHGPLRLEYKRPCIDTQSRDESNLCAAWNAAAAADKSAAWAGWQLLVGLFGVIGLGWTLWFNYQAWDAARHAEAEAAVSRRLTSETLEHAKITANRQIRPYLVYQGFESVPMVISETVNIFGCQIKEMGRVFMPEFINDGKSPALSVSSHMDWCITDNNTVPFFQHPGVLEGKGVVGPNRPQRIGDVVFSDLQLEPVRSKEAKVWIRCLVRYKELGNQTNWYETETTLQIGYHGTRGEFDGTIKEIWRSQPLGPQNRTS